MNKKRRQELKEIAERIRDQIWRIEYIKEEEQDALDNIPENLKYSKKAETIEDNCTKLDDIYNQLEDIADAIDKLTEE